MIGLKVRKNSVDCTRVRHDLLPAIHESLVENLLEHVPDTLHEVQVHGLVVVVEVNPAPHPIDSLPPLARILHNDALALGVVLVDSHLQHFALVLDVEGLIDFVLHGKSVAIPAKSPLDVVPGLSSVPTNDILNRLMLYFDGSGADVPIMGESRREGRPVVEGEGR